MSLLRPNTILIACLLTFLVILPVTPGAFAQGERPGLLKIVEAKYPIQAPRAYSFSVTLRVEYAFRDYNEIHAAIYEGPRGALDHPIWESNPEQVIEEGEKIYQAELKSPSQEEEWVLTSYAFYSYNNSAPSYFADEEQGPGFTEISIKIADNVKLTLETPRANMQLYVDDASYSTDANGILIRDVAVLSEHKIEAPKNLSLGQGWRSTFLGWNGTDSTNPKTLMITSDLLVKADFSDEFYLAIVSDVPGVSGEGWYASGAIAYFTAAYLVPAAGWEGLLGVQWKFARWSGDVDSTSIKELIVMDQPHRVVASWTLDYGGLYSTVIAVAALAIVGTVVFFVRRKLRSSPEEPEPEPGPENPPANAFCIFCGAEIDPEATVCAKCGKSQTGSGS